MCVCVCVCDCCVSRAARWLSMGAFCSRLRAFVGLLAALFKFGMEAAGTESDRNRELLCRLGRMYTDNFVMQTRGRKQLHSRDSMHAIAREIVTKRRCDDDVLGSVTIDLDTCIVCNGRLYKLTAMGGASRRCRYCEHILCDVVGRGDDPSKTCLQEHEDCCIKRQQGKRHRVD